MVQEVNLDPVIFREYDIRGIIQDTLSTGVANAIGKAFGSIVSDMNLRTVAVGWDGRLSSPEISTALVNGLVSTGVTVYTVGLGPSPMLYFSAHTMPVDSAVMVTGSHNPPDYNGFKFVLQNEPFFGEDIQRLRSVAAAGDFAQGQGKITESNQLENYVARVLEDYKSTRGLRVAWDPGNGSTGDAVQLLTKKLPGKHFIINGQINGNFPSHHPDPTVPKNLEQLIKLVLEKKCDVGFSFDGDGDRIGVVDSRGRIIWGDQLLIILASEILKEQPGSPILCDVKASRAFFNSIREMGGEAVMWKTGHSHIKAKMKEINAPLAGEMSAHIFFKHRYYGYDDALYTAVRVLSLLINQEESLAQKIDHLPKWNSTPEIRFYCSEAQKFEVVRRIADQVKKVKNINFCDIDGIRVEMENGWWLVRASNTQPALVARCEAINENELKKLKGELENYLLQNGIKPPKM
ncbi:MAG: Phosphomannomutase/phosphoglucomutase [Alphaproteobacteria bacterium MarineAlpha3_Bin5]|nr:phosphomannomutase [Magnetovibrio sp.]PPR79090.1 MAG: Phosphomannomutase/phosphoglucomutase [Alphaproteobacteria bacterium MarineAlpha3_Bin5]